MPDCSRWVCTQLLKYQSEFNQGLKDLNEEMRRLLSDLIDLKDIVKIDSLKNSVIASMEAILKASQYIRDHFEKDKYRE